MAGMFQATMGGNLGPLISLRDDNMDINSMITTYNKAATDATCEIIWNERHRNNILLCTERRDSKKWRYETLGAKEYKKG